MLSRPGRLAWLAAMIAVAGCGTTVPMSARVGSPSAPSAATQTGGSAGSVAPTAIAGAPSPLASGPGLALSPSSPGSQPATPAVGQSSAVAAAGGLPTTGHGWDAKSIYIGIPTEEDLHGVASSLSLSFDPGSIKGDAQAVVNDINAAGGLFGRHIVALFMDNSTASLQSNPSGQAQANCTYFTQDNKVVAVFNAVAPIDVDAWRGCLQQSGTPLFSVGYETYDDTIYKQFGPYLWTSLTPDLTSFVPGWISSLHQMGFFSGWNTTLATAGPGPVKVGILEPSTPIGARVAAAMTATLKSLGVTVAAEYDYSGATPDMSPAVLHFRAAGVTQVLQLSTAASDVFLFMEAAESQSYRPREGFSSFSLPQFMQSNDGLLGKQLDGAMGVGWVPGGDVSQLPPASPAEQACQASLARGGQTFSAARQTALWVALILCDSIHVMRDGALKAGGLSPPLLASGIDALGPGYPIAATFGNALSPTDHALPGLVRNFAWTPGCSCFAYTSGPYAL